ncbi:MAG: hypothetical protein QN152_13585 [Armatimonadota bacterium]|nr:hypothetical protein [Armatimonadota bacterium]MDR7427596.1 hypothetical protein [Armatimonadota bacterium]MDR7464475.1 hypothetical protein [Armatimonadota bacterium]MDR7469747.1 hypothetical protein [Armatimonadota bacterium]MDR7474646.1 hypothetical protein [Armatimonadota bacterium]
MWRQVVTTRRRWWLVVPFAGGMLLTALFVGASAVMLSPTTIRSPRHVEVVIPAGAAQMVERGEWIPGIPSEIVFVTGDVLTVRNQDRVAHQAGPFWVPAGTSLNVPLNRPTVLRYACSFLATGRLGLEVRPRIGPVTLVWHTVALGVPVGVGLSVVFFVVSQL